MPSIDRRALALLAAAALIGIGAAAIVRVWASRPAVHVLLIDAPASTPTAPEAQITGAVARPGVYPISSGERLDGLIADAGGVTADADSSRLNLARRVSDGERVDVPIRSSDVSAGPDRVRINHASRDELLTLPGVTVGQAAAIQSSIRKQGSIASGDDLVARRLASQAQVAQFGSLVDWAP